MLLTFAICQDEVAVRPYESLVFGLQLRVAGSATVCYCTVCTNTQRLPLCAKRATLMRFLFLLSSPKQINCSLQGVFQGYFCVPSKPPPKTPQSYFFPSKNDTDAAAFERRRESRLVLVQLTRFSDTRRFRSLCGGAEREAQGKREETMKDR